MHQDPAHRSFRGGSGPESLRRHQRPPSTCSLSARPHVAARVKSTLGSTRIRLPVKPSPSESKAPRHDRPGFPAELGERPRRRPLTSPRAIARLRLDVDNISSAIAARRYCARLLVIGANSQRQRCCPAMVGVQSEAGQHPSQANSTNLGDLEVQASQEVGLLEGRWLTCSS